MRRTNRLPLAIFLLFSGLYLLSMSGHTYSPDEETMLAVTRSLLTNGNVAVVAEAGAPLSALRPGRGDGRYSPYGVLPSLLALPLHMLGSSLGGATAGGRDYAARLAVTALNAPVTAATAALLAAWALALGASRRWAVALALLYGFATFAWPYARTFFSEPLAALLLLGSAYYAFQSTEPTQGRLPLRPLVLSGLAAGLLLTTRVAAGIALPVLGLYVLWSGWRTPGRPKPSSALAYGGLWLLALLPGLALLLWYNLARFGTPLASGYASEAGLFTTPLSEGLVGLLFSPGKSVLLYAPPLLLALPGGLALWRRGRRDVVLLSAGLFLSHLLLYARWGEWRGGGVWGPRFLLPVLAPLLVLGAGLFPAVLKKDSAAAAGSVQHTRLLTQLAVLLLALGGGIGNLGGVLLNFGTYVVAPTPSDKLSSLAGSPLVGHWRMLIERWAHYTAPPPVCRLGDGFYASESPGGAPLPRRTGAAAELHCAASGLGLRFTLDDRRPPNAPPSALHLWLNGQALEAPSGQLREYRLLLPPGTNLIRIEAHTWNPLAVGFSERNDDLGPQLDGLQGVSGATTALTVVDTAVAPLPSLPRPRWAWYYDPANQHLVDHWAWYLPRSELAGTPWLLATSLVVVALAALAAGLRLLRPN